jgi:hypothetical protein
MGKDQFGHRSQLAISHKHLALSVFAFLRGLFFAFPDPYFPKGILVQEALLGTGS